MFNISKNFILKNVYEKIDDEWKDWSSREKQLYLIIKIPKYLLSE